MAAEMTTAFILYHSRGVPDCKQVNTGLKDFLEKFYSRNYFDDDSVDSNSGTII